MFRIMGRVRWRIREFPHLLKDKIKERLNYIKLCVLSITYNHHMSQSYASDICLEPIFWFVDNFTHLLGPFFVFGVYVLTFTVVFISYWVGLPFWWKKSQEATVMLMIVGHWLLINVLFHYYMAVTTSPGYPPPSTLVEASSICKKCIMPKPSRSHHCSICSRCILKMDHHCPWLNNCVGFGNHRYFYLYMVYTAIGSLFIIIFGFEIGIRSIWLDEDSGWLETEPLHGHPVRFNLSGHLIYQTEMNEYGDNGLKMAQHDLPVPQIISNSKAKHRAILFMALINVAVVMALGGLTIWHGKLISRGETSIEAHINQSETKRLKALGKDYQNPYNFGTKKNWKIFLGLVQGRNFWRNVLIPSKHNPVGNGLTWYTIDTSGITTHKDWP